MIRIVLLMSFDGDSFGVIRWIFWLTNDPFSAIKRETLLTYKSLKQVYKIKHMQTSKTRTEE